MCVRRLPAKVKRTLAAKKAWRTRKSISAVRHRTDEVREIYVGDKVEAGEGQDHDVGRVQSIDQERALVAWQTGVKTWTPIEGLKPWKGGE